MFLTSGGFVVFTPTVKPQTFHPKILHFPISFLVLPNQATFYFSKSKKQNTKWY
jgi:hypothetical protein